MSQEETLYTLMSIILIVNRKELEQNLFRILIYVVCTKSKCTNFFIEMSIGLT